MNHPEVVLNNAVAAIINQHGLSTFPNECCGFLYGSEGESRLITDAVPVANNKEGDQRRRFEISPADYMRAEKYALQNNTQLLGVYHSHPNHPAIASDHDLAVAMPFFSYVIISVYQGEVRDLKSWRLKDDSRVFYEENIVVAKETPMSS